MRKFYVGYIVYYTDEQTVVFAIIDLEPGEKANAETFQSKINEIYHKSNEIPFCNDVLSWSLIEE